MTEKWRAVTRIEPADFYSEWLAASEQDAADLAHSPVVARGRDITWIETVNDYRLGMLIGTQVGFPSSGTNLCRATIPAGHHTGRHRHGEEAIHILSGTGFIVVDDRRYEFHLGTTIHIPFMSTHQLFNTGSDEVEYVTASAMDLDLFVKLGRLEQFEEKGPNGAGFESAFRPRTASSTRKGRRIALHLEDAPDEQKRRDEIRAAAAAAGDGHVVGRGRATVTVTSGKPAGEEPERPPAWRRS